MSKERAEEPGSHYASVPARETIGAFEAKTHLPRLLREAAAGKRFLITQRGTPVAELVPLSPANVERRRGDMAGKIEMADDFCDRVPELEKYFS